jgi:hypothetical protein
VTEGTVPQPKELFLLSAALTDAARRRDARGLRLGLEVVATLHEDAPDEPAWDAYRGHLTATMQFAWLLARAEHADESLAARS